MPSRKKSNIETVLPETPTRKRVVAAKHTVVYEAPEIVEIPISDDDEDAPSVEVEEQEQQQRQPSFRTKLRDKFKARGIGGDETLTLRIDRLPLYEQNGMAGVKTEKEFCGVIQCTEKFFDTDEYLIELQRRYGPGEYWLTVRHKNSIVSSWRERLGGFPIAPMVVTNEPGQPPQIIYQQPAGQAAAPRSMKDELRDVAEMVNLVEKIRGPREENPPPSAPLTDPDAILISSLAGNDKFMDKISNGLIGKLIGRNGSGDDDPSPWAVAMEAIKTGQAAAIVKMVIDGVFTGISGMIPRGQNNGTSQMGAPLLANQELLQTRQQQSANHGGQNENPQAVTQGMAGIVETGPHASPQQQQMTPADQALMTVLADCSRKIPVQVTFTNLMKFADEVNDKAPAYSFDGWIMFFADMPIDDALAFVKSLPNGEQVASLPHAKGWTEQLQKLIKEDQEGGDE